MRTVPMNVGQDATEVQSEENHPTGLGQMKYERRKAPMDVCFLAFVLPHPHGSGSRLIIQIFLPSTWSPAIKLSFLSDIAMGT
jgi:hypothetical protein